MGLGGEISIYYVKYLPMLAVSIEDVISGPAVDKKYTPLMIGDTPRTVWNQTGK